jgi:hypothetical protein
MKTIKISTLVGAFMLTCAAYGQEPQKMQVQPMKKETQTLATPANEQEGNNEQSGEVKKVKTAPVRKAETKAVEPKEQVAEPKKD